MLGEAATAAIILAPAVVIIRRFLPVRSREVILDSAQIAKLLRDEKKACAAGR